LLPPRLLTELEELRQKYNMEIIEEPSLIDLLLRNFPTSELYNRPRVTVLVRLPRVNPDAGPDMFWTDPDLTLADGSVPLAGNLIEAHLGSNWRRFSWHHGPWKPNGVYSKKLVSVPI
jgi:hypothetical protein